MGGRWDGPPAAWSGRNGAERLVRTAFVLLVALALASAACGSSTSHSTSTSSPAVSGSASAGGNGKLDPAVSMPKGFPSDFPVYPGARLTSAGEVTLNGQMTWGVQWETLQSVDSVQGFYSRTLDEGDWTITFNGSSKGAFSVIFSRRSNSKIAGILTVESESNVTHIQLALGVPG